jgi:hypothetical protein
MSIDQIYPHKVRIGIIIYSLIIAIGFHSYSSAETVQKSKQVEEAVSTTQNSSEKTDNKNSSIQKEPSGFKVYIDPKTGKFLERPKEAPVTHEEEGINSLETQQVEEPAVEMPAPGGGVMLERPGGFLHESTATIDTNGKLVINCSEHNEN